MRERPTRRWDGETAILAVIASFISLIAFLHFFRRGEILLNGDTVAHLNIARRVFDSRTPGLLQLGTVWLPLPHLLMIPFLLSHSAWQSGLGGSIPSMLAYVFGVLGIFRLVRGALSVHADPDIYARVAAWLAAGIYAANPNLIYLQSTAMTEPLSLALFIWTVVYFREFVQTCDSRQDSWEADASRALVKCGLCVLGASLTRYDGWFLAAVLSTITLFLVPKRTEGLSTLKRGLRKFVLLAIAGPALWLAYNGLIYRNPLEFANGPYSAKAIEQRMATPGFASHPGANNLAVAGLYFVKAAEMNLAEGTWQQRLWLIVAVAGVLVSLLSDARLWPLLVLWVPLPFYMLSVAYGGVPIFVPVWWPFSYYNDRFGLELLPAVAVFVALATYWIAGLARNAAAQIAVAAAVLALVAGSYVSVWRAQPICFREAWANSRTRVALDRELATTLKKLPADATILMYLGDHVGALQYAGIPLRQTINEGNHRTWRQPSDPQGLWERALADPSQYADYVVAVDNDPVALAMRGKQLAALAEIHVSGQPQAVVYATRHRE